MSYELILSENILKGSCLSLLQQRICSDQFNWNYCSNKIKDDSYYSFSHVVAEYDNGFVRSFSEMYDSTLYAALDIKDSFEGLENYQIGGLKWGLATSYSSLISKAAYKLESYQKELCYSDSIKTIIFYLNESDGDTCFYDKEDKVEHVMPPKENCAILFDEDIYYSHSKPINYPQRIVLTINLIKI